MPKSSKQNRQSIDKLIAAAVNEGSPEGLTKALALARWGADADIKTNIAYILADWFHRLAARGPQEMATNLELQQEADKADALLAHLAQSAMWLNEPEFYEQLVKAMRQVKDGLYDSVAPDKPRLAILLGLIKGDLNISKLAKETGIDERHLRRIKARIVPKKHPTVYPEPARTPLILPPR
jgi:hypothetical protein